MATRRWRGAAPNERSTRTIRKKKIPLGCGIADGETRTRTGDTTIFSRVLYQLSYLAVAA
jgi:hypothetical protein